MAMQYEGGFMPDDPRLGRIQAIAQQYEISPQIVSRLAILAQCEIVLLVDDSGSMSTRLQGTNQTRWDEMRQLVSIVAELAVVMDSDGIDVYFLNRQPLLNVTNTETIKKAFNNRPQGGTPICGTLRKILAAKRTVSYEKKLVVLIATDGVPTDGINTLEAILRKERTPQTYVSFLACTDNLKDVAYLSSWDKTIPNVDVTDDYRSERAEIQRTRGPTFPFSFGDYIVKAMLGALDPWFDSLDDKA